MGSPYQEVDQRSSTEKEELTRLARAPLQTNRMRFIDLFAGLYEHFDFVAGPERIEVKSSSNRQREHYFSLAQLSSPRPSRVVVASVFVERVGGGFSLRRVFEEVRNLLGDNPALVVQFDASFYAALGTGWADAMDECFDWELAEESLAFYDAGTVPSVASPIPPTVSDVRFRSDLSCVTPLLHDELHAAGVLFAAVTPTTWSH